MNIFSNKFINILSFIISIVIFFIINFFIENSNKQLNQNYPEPINQEIISQENNNQENKIEKTNKKNPEYDWYIEIKSISLKAPIKETTNMNILENYVGHFENTATTLGNIGLAAHNSGYKNNYFKNLDNVKKGDEIIYKYNNFEKNYIINKKEIIKNTDWSYLEKQEKNVITLITCINSKPEFRLCVQGIEK